MDECEALGITSVDTLFSSSKALQENKIFKLKDNMSVKELPGGIFRTVSFKYIWIEETVVEKIFLSAILKSQDQLEGVKIIDSRLEEFPFQFLPNFTHLKSLSLYSNYLTSVPALQSQSLESFSVSNNTITRVEEDGWATPSLKFLALSGNPLSAFPSKIFKGLQKLQSFFCAGCNLGPTLSNGFLEFGSQALKVVSLLGNYVSRLESNAITGIQPDTKVYLSENRIETLRKEAFHTMLANLSLGTGLLYMASHQVRLPDDMVASCFTSFDKSEWLLRRWDGSEISVQKVL
ncbi:unnamed protein product [Darwinula stevensoni]|uniref:Uncharacterized protein n=1 Tax=Darwinula stevensoni TaxID=69355 RepID=A0A7R8X5D8_9CRUS|nr:unnamed protein product [Darwinula stevensoni]CAG0886993.1 unnamed protein product [Darwinula stevensoni]